MELLPKLNIKPLLVKHNTKGAYFTLRGARLYFSEYMTRKSANNSFSQRYRNLPDYIHGIHACELSWAPFIEIVDANHVNVYGYTKELYAKSI